MYRSGKREITNVYAVVEQDCREHYRWVKGWFAFYAGMLCVLIPVTLLANDPATKHATFIGAIGCGLGIAGMFIHVLTGTACKGEYHLGFLNVFGTHLGEHRGVGVEEPSHQGELRSAIESRAELEKLARHWANRLLAPFVVTVLSLLLWLVFDELLFAVLNEVIGLVITQVQHYTMPSAALDFVSGTIEAFDG